MAVSGIAKIYERSVKSGKLNDDTAQKLVVEHLQTLSSKFSLSPKQSVIRGLLPSSRRPAAPRGLYIWGDVGRGKSLLMDMFFDSAPVAKKKRVHFYSLMLGIHKNVHTLRQRNIENPVEAATRELAASARLLCIDEFQVTDVADAMILTKLFTILLEENVTIVITSNRPPESLYLGGLQREKFLNFVKLVNERMDVLELASPHDYRMEKIRHLKSVYLYPLTKKNEVELQHIFADLIHHADPVPLTLEVQGRKLAIAKTCGKFAWFTFSELCEKPLGAADYLAIAQKFHTACLSGIPLLSPEKRNEARRFVMLIDSLYDQRVKLICTAAGNPQELYPAGDGIFEFGRTVSRLMEMQSEQYLGDQY